MMRRETLHSEHSSRSAAKAAAATIDAEQFSVRIWTDRVASTTYVFTIERIELSKNVHVVR